MTFAVEPRAAVALRAPDALADPASLPVAPTGWRQWIGPLVSFAILGAVLLHSDDLDWHAVAGLMPRSPAFWLLFAVQYLIPPFSDWLIYRRLWRLPPGGFAALIRKRISNEIVLGYIGEVYFYGWVRRNVRLSGSAFGAIKDAAIISAAVGNAFTLALLAISWPLLGALHLGMSGTLLLLSIGTVTLSSLVTMLFRRRLFSLPRQELWFITAMYTGRVAATAVMTAALWHLALPTVGLSWWLILSTLRLVVSRLPFVPNKDVVFAGVAVFVIGRGAEIGDLMAMMAAAMLGTHLLLGAGLSLGELIGLARPRCDG